MSRLSTVLGLVVCAVLIAFYSHTQDRIEYQDGHPYDGGSYWHQAKLVDGDQPLRNWKPFVYRMGAPFVVGEYYPPIATKVAEVLGAPKGDAPIQAFGRDPDDLLDGFTWLGFVSGLTICVLLFFILRQYGLGAPLCFGLLSLYIANPHSPFRFSPYFPAFADPLAFVFFFGMFLAYKRDLTLSAGTTLVLCILGFLGGFVRETILLAPLTFFGVHLWRAVFRKGNAKLLSQTTWMHLLPFASIASALYMTRGLAVEAMGDYDQITHAQAIWNRNWDYPEILYLCAFAVLGPFVVWLLASLGKAKTYAFLGRHPELVLYTIGMTILSVTGGSHTDRFVFWILPGLLPWLGFLIQERVGLPRHRVIAAIFLTALLVTQVLAYRTFLPIPPSNQDSLNYPGTPEYHLFASYGESASFGQLQVAFMGRENRMALVAQFTGLALFLICLLAADRWLATRKHPRKAPITSPPEPAKIV